MQVQREIVLTHNHMLLGTESYSYWCRDADFQLTNSETFSPWDNARLIKKNILASQYSVQMDYLEKWKYIALTVAKKWTNKPVTNKCSMTPTLCGESISYEVLHRIDPAQRISGDFIASAVEGLKYIPCINGEMWQYFQSSVWLIYHTAWPIDRYSCVASTTSIFKVEVFKCNINHVGNFCKEQSVMSSMDKQVFWKFKH